jgi:hypothetical protein
MDGGLHQAAEQAAPRLVQAHHPVVHRPGTVVELGGRCHEETSPRIRALPIPDQPPFHQALQPDAPACELVSAVCLLSPSILDLSDLRYIFGFEV